MSNKAKNVLTLNHEEAMEFFMKSEQYHGFELPEYFTFDGVLRSACETVGDALYEVRISSKNVGCVPYALRIIRRMIDSLKDMDEKRSIIDLVYRKLCNQPNTSYNLLWLQNMTIHRTRSKAHPLTPSASVSW